MRFICDQGCVVEGSKKSPPPRTCPDHGSPFIYEKQLRRTTPLRRDPEKRQAEVRGCGSTLKAGRGFAVTKAQREKVQGLPCVGCGREKSEYVAIDPAHIWSLGSRCTDPLCIIPLCRTMDGGCHRPYDQRELDLLSLLIERGYYAELGHVISAHQVSPLTLTQRTTGQEWLSVGDPPTTTGAALAAPDKE